MLCVVRGLLVFSHRHRVLSLCLVRLFSELGLFTIGHILPQLSKLLCNLDHRVVRMGTQDILTLFGRPKKVRRQRSLGSIGVFRGHC